MNLYSFNFIYVVYGDLRISGRSSYKRLEFRLRNGTWGTVCSTGFDDKAALVACQQLGYSNALYHSRK